MTHCVVRFDNYGHDDLHYFMNDVAFVPLYNASSREVIDGYVAWRSCYQIE